MNSDGDVLFTSEGKFGTVFHSLHIMKPEEIQNVRRLVRELQTRMREEEYWRELAKNEKTFLWEAIEAYPGLVPIKGILSLILHEQFKTDIFDLLVSELEQVRSHKKTYDQAQRTVLKHVARECNIGRK